MKKVLQNLGRILSILLVYIICNLAGFRICLTEYAVHSLSPCYGLLTALVLLNSVARWCNTAIFFQHWCNFTCLCAWGSEGFIQGGTSGFF